MPRPIRHYKNLFEDLMQYTTVKDSSEIKTNKDLFAFFGQVKSDALKRKRRFSVSKRLFKRTSEALALSERRGEVIVSRRVKVIKSKKMFKTFASARVHEATVQEDDKLVYKSFITKKGETQVRWRDKKGRFTKTPK